MASASLQPSYVELWREHGITRPEPLRIVKERANTVAGCSASREVPMPRKGSAAYPDASSSSPEGQNKPLTVHKRRKARGSILDGSLCWNPPENSMPLDLKQPTDFCDILGKDNDGTPRAGRLSTGTRNVDSFYKSELSRDHSESNITTGRSRQIKAQSRNPERNSNTLNENLPPPFKPANATLNQQVYTNQPQRRHSKGRMFVSKAFDSFGNARSKSMHFLRPKPSKNSSLRQVSLRNLGPSHPIPSEASPPTFRPFSLEQSIDTVDTSIISVVSANKPSPSPIPPVILYPEIAVIPEVDSVEANNEASIWVAVVVTGVLRSTGGPRRIPDKPLSLENSSTCQDGMTLDHTDYGYLYGVDIKLAARKGCILETIAVERSKSRRLYLGQTELILAKVKLLVAKTSFSHVRESSIELIAELESHLGNITTEYLDVGISYKHSEFPTSRGSTYPPNGLSYHATNIKIKAHAFIKRHCSQSPWGNRNAGGPVTTGISNPVASLINTYCDPVKGAKLITKMATNPVPSAEKGQQGLDTSCCLNSSSSTVVQTQGNSSTNVLHDASQQDLPISTPANKQSLDITRAELHDTYSNVGTLALNPCSEPDPARKIWSEMRRNSRGTVICRPQGTKGSSEAFEPGIGEENDGCSDAEVSMKKEQARIMEIALKNKRSVGADTLRSMAAPATVFSMGWSWGPPWW